MVEKKELNLKGTIPMYHRALKTLSREKGLNTSKFLQKANINMGTVRKLIHLDLVSLNEERSGKIYRITEKGKKFTHYSERLFNLVSMRKC